MKEVELKINGMKCAACELVIENKVSKLDGVKKADAKLSSGTLHLQVKDNTDLSSLKNKIDSQINEDGYSLEDNSVKNKRSLSKKELRDYITALAIAILVVAIFFGIQATGIAENYGAAEINLAFVFFIGIIASISTCMAVVGSLVLSISSQYAKVGATKALITFHMSRLVSFFVLGGVIGLIGSAFTLTMQTTLIINLILFLVLVLMGLNLLGFEFATKLLPRMPKSLVKSHLNSDEQKGKINLITPAILGAITFFLPCGFTQSMQIFSLGTGSFVNGAITMFVFALGTFPVLALISFASIKLSKTLQSSVFFKTAGLIVILFALYNLYSSLIASGIL